MHPARLPSRKKKKATSTCHIITFFNLIAAVLNETWIKTVKKSVGETYWLGQCLCFLKGGGGGGRIKWVRNNGGWEVASKNGGRQ